MNIQNQKPFVSRRSGVGTGATSLLMIFTVLCFATLAMLSFSTAAANMRIQRRGMQNGQNISAARGAAAQGLAALDEKLYALSQSYAQGNITQQQYQSGALAAAPVQGWQLQQETGNLQLIIQIDDTNELLTEIAISPPGQAQRYTVLRQVTRLIGGWHPGAGGSLWQQG